MSLYDDYERERQRRVRTEYRIILELLKELQFDYVVKEHVPAKICFNSGRERFSEIPQKCETSTKEAEVKVLSAKQIKPTSVFISTVPRFSENPEISFRTFRYLGQKGSICKNLPFGKSSANRSGFLFDDRVNTPGPGTYFHDGLSNSQSSMVIVCSPWHLAKCFICKGKIPEGCFWRNFRKKRDLCRTCMSQESHLKKTHRVMLRFNKVTELQQFMRVKNCTFYHKHEGTPAAVQFIPKREVKKRFQREKYLMKFPKFSRIC